MGLLGKLMVLLGERRVRLASFFEAKQRSGRQVGQLWALLALTLLAVTWMDGLMSGLRALLLVAAFIMVRPRAEGGFAFSSAVLALLGLTLLTVLIQWLWSWIIVFALFGAVLWGWSRKRKQAAATQTEQAADDSQGTSVPPQPNHPPTTM